MLQALWWLIGRGKRTVQLQQAASVRTICDRDFKRMHVVALRHKRTQRELRRRLDKLSNVLDGQLSYNDFSDQKSQT